MTASSSTEIDRSGVGEKSNSILKDVEIGSNMELNVKISVDMWTSYHKIKPLRSYLPMCKLLLTRVRSRDNTTAIRQKQTGVQ